VVFPPGTDNVYGVNLSAYGSQAGPAPGPCFEICGTYSNTTAVTDQATVVDEFRVGSPRSGAVYYQYTAVAGANLEEAGETGILALLYVGKNVSVKKMQLLSAGEQTQDMIVPSAEMTAEGLVRLLAGKKGESSCEAQDFGARSSLWL
jgi:hypothetical protein